MVDFTLRTEIFGENFSSLFRSSIYFTKGYNCGSPTFTQTVLWFLQSNRDFEGVFTVALIGQPDFLTALFICLGDALYYITISLVVDSSFCEFLSSVSAERTGIFKSTLECYEANDFKRSSPSACQTDRLLPGIP